MPGCAVRYPEPESACYRVDLSVDLTNAVEAIIHPTGGAGCLNTR